MVLIGKKEYLEQLNKGEQLRPCRIPEVPGTHLWGGGLALSCSRYNWQERYLVEFGEGTNWKQKYYQMMEKSLLSQLSFLTLYNFDYNRRMKQNPLIKSHATEIINIFCTNPILLEMLDLPVFNKAEKYYSGRHTTKDIIREAFEFLILNYPQPDIQKLYNSIKWF